MCVYIYTYNGAKEKRESQWAQGLELATLYIDICMYAYRYVCILYICVCMCVYIYTYNGAEEKRESQWAQGLELAALYIDIDVYVYLYIYVCV